MAGRAYARTPDRRRSAQGARRTRLRDLLAISVAQSDRSGVLWGLGAAALARLSTRTRLRDDCYDAAAQAAACIHITTFPSTVRATIL